MHFPYPEGQAPSCPTSDLRALERPQRCNGNVVGFRILRASRVPPFLVKEVVRRKYGFEVELDPPVILQRKASTIQFAVISLK